MAVTATNVFMDISSATFTPTNVGDGSAVTIDEATQASFSIDGTVKFYSGALSKGPRVKAIRDCQRHITLRGANLAILMTNKLKQGVMGTLTFTVADVYNGIGTGALNVTLQNCSLDSAGITQHHNEFGSFDAKFSAVWSDGVTDPLSVTQVV